jgi:hypothetical protein
MSLVYNLVDSLSYFMNMTAVKGFIEVMSDPSTEGCTKADPMMHVKGLIR